MSPQDANRVFNQFVADRTLPPPIFHDHFIGRPGGLAIFFVESLRQRDSLLDQGHLVGWEVEVRPLVFSASPSAF